MASEFSEYVKKRKAEEEKQGGEPYYSDWRDEFMAYKAKRDAAEGKLEASVGALGDRVSKWRENAGKYYTDYATRYDVEEGSYVYRGDTEDYLNNVTTGRDDLNREAASIKRELEFYKPYVSEEYYNYLIGALDGSIKGDDGSVITFDTVVDNATRDHDFYSQFEDEAAYKSAYYNHKFSEEYTEIDSLEKAKSALLQFEDLAKSQSSNTVTGFRPSEEDKARQQYLTQLVDYYNTKYYDADGEIAADLQSAWDNFYANEYVDSAGADNDEIEALDRSQATEADLTKRQKDHEDKVALRDKLLKHEEYESYRQNEDFAEGSKYIREDTDEMYEYINGNEDVVNAVDGSPDEMVKAFFGVGRSFLKSLSDNEKSIYNYLHNLDKNDGGNRADEYIEFLSLDLKKSHASKMFNKYLKDQTALELIFSAQAGLGQFADGISGIFKDEYDPSIVSLMGQMAREDLADDGLIPYYDFVDGSWKTMTILGSSGAQALYDIGSTTANMLPSILVSLAVEAALPTVGEGGVVFAGLTAAQIGAGAGALTLGASAMGNAKQEMLSMGYSVEQATAYGLMVGASEAGLSYLLGGIPGLRGSDGIFSAAGEQIIGKIDNAIAKAAIALGGNMLDEGLEEGLQTVLETWFKEIATGVDFEDPSADEILYSSLLGALTAAGFGGANLAIDYIGKKSNEYVSAKQNHKLLSIVNKVEKGQFDPKERVEFGTVDERTASKIKSLTGIDAQGFNVVIEAGQINHILLDHGKNGKTDKSMSDNADIAKMEYAIQNFDDISLGKYTKAYKNTVNGKTQNAKTVLYEKSIGEKSYYVVQAVPDTKAKTLYIVTAFIGQKGYKKEASQLINAKGPNATSQSGSASASGASQLTNENNLDLTSKTEIANTPISSISQESGFVNSENLATPVGQANYYASILKMGENGTRGLVNLSANLPDGVDLGEAAIAFNAIYSQGKSGKALSAAKNMELLSPEQRQYAYNLGIMDKALDGVNKKSTDKAKANQEQQMTAKDKSKLDNVSEEVGKETSESITPIKDLTNDQRKTVKLGEKLGVKVVFASIKKGKENIDGKWDGKVLYINPNPNSKKPYFVLFKHELTHFAELSKKYAHFLKTVADSAEFAIWLNDNGFKNMDEYTAKIISDYKRIGKDLSREMAEREAVANFVGDVLFKGDKSIDRFMNELAGEHKRTFGEFIREFIDWIKEKLGNVDEVAMLEKMYAELFRDAKDVENNSIEQNEKGRYAFNDSFGQQLRDWQNGNGKSIGTYNGRYFKLGTTPDVLTKHGAPSGEVIMFEDCLLKITGLKHSISLDELAKIPSQLNDPILLFKGSVENSFVALTEIKDKLGNDVIVAIHINKKMGRSVINKITSVYSKTDDFGNNKINNYVSEQIRKGNLLDASIKKAPNWFTTSGLQLPHVVQTILDANNSISQNSEKSTQKTKKFSDNDGGQLSYTPPNEGISNREILANLLETEDMSPSEKGFLTKYKNKIAQIEANEAEISEMESELKELRRSGKKDSSRAITLEGKIKNRELEIARDENMILNLEATKPIKELLKREKNAAYAEGMLAGQMAQGRQDAAKLRKTEEKLAEQKRKDGETLAEYKKRVAKREADIKQKNREKLAEQREKARENLDAQAKRYQESRKKATEGRHKTAMRHKIAGVVSELDRLLRKGTKERNVKIGLQDAVAAALEIFDLNAEKVERYNKAIADLDARIAATTDPVEIEALTELRDKKIRNSERLADKLQVMKKAYEDIHNGRDGENYPSYYKAECEAIENRIAEVMEKVGDTPIGDMSLEQLEAVYDMYRMVLTTVRNANKVFRDGKLADLTADATDMTSELQRIKKLAEERLKAGDDIRSFVWNELTPYYAFNRIGSETLMSYYHELIRGQDVYARDIEEAQSFAETTRKKHGYSKWKLDQVHSFKDKDGRDFRLTLRHMMSIYAYSKREQAFDHMEKGGFFFNNKETFRKKAGVLEFIASNESGYKVDARIFAQIKGALTAEQIAYVDEMQAYLTKMGEKGNEITRVMWGIDIFKEAVYFPLKSKEDFIYQANTPAETSSLKNDGMTKETRPHASNPIVLESFDDVWANHVEKMSKYHGFVIPIDNLNKLVNYGTWIEGETQAETNGDSDVIDLSGDTELSAMVEGIYGSTKYKKIAQYILNVLGKKEISLSDGRLTIVDNSDALHIANRAAPRKTAKIAKIKEIIKNARIYAQDANVDHNKFDLFYYYEATVRYDGETFPVYLNIGRAKNDGKYHIYDITNEIRDTADRINGLERPKPNEGYALKNGISNNSISQPDKNVNRNFSTNSEMGSHSISTMLEARFGPGVNDYLNTFIKDLNGAKAQSGAIATFATNLVSKFKKTSVAASLSVVVQQPTAILRALSEIDAKYFTHIPKPELLNKKWKRIQKYAPIAILKDIGGFDAGAGRQITEWINADTKRGVDRVMNKIDDITMYGAALGDRIGWSTIWTAVEREVLAKQKLDYGSEAFYEAVGKRFTDVIVKTQVYDSTLSRSGFMRGKDGLMKMATAFMGEPTLSINMLADTLLQAKRGKISKGQVVRTFAAVYTATVAASIIKSFIYALRDDDEDESLAEKYMQALGGSILNDINPLSMLPILRDVVSIFQGWDVERTDMAVVQDLYNAINSLGSEKKTTYRKIEDLAGAVAALVGVPVKNVMRTAREIYNAIDDIFDGIDGGDLGDAFIEGITGKEAGKRESMYNALISGDPERIEIYRDSYDSEDEYLSAVKQVLREYDPRVQKAVEGALSGSYGVYNEMKAAVKAEKHFDVKTVNNAFADEKEYVLGKLNDARKARREGNSEEFDKIVKQLVERGYSEEFVRKKLKYMH